ncbi:MAG: PAS domain-containing protein [Bryobacterales bacterium]|nr:PAS domain-containing protein [Bryobacterales bacterium]
MTEQIPKPALVDGDFPPGDSLNFREIVDAMPGGFLILSPEGTIEVANLASAGLLGRPGLNLCGVSLAGFLAHGAAQHLHDLLTQVIGCNDEARCKLEALGVDGASRWLHVEAKRCLVAGQPKCRVFLSRAAHQGKPDLLLRRLALVARLTTNLVVITDANGIIEWVNEGFTRTTGFTFDEAVGRRPGQFLQGPDTDRAEVERIRESVRAGRSVLAELLNYKKDGTSYWLRLEIQPIRSESGVIDGFIAVETDISEERERREKVAQAATRLQLAADAAGIGVWELTVKDLKLTWDAAMRRIFGYGCYESVPATHAEWLERVIPEDRDAALQQISQALAAKSRFEIFYRILRRDGAVRRVRSIGAVLTDRVLGVLIDDTERLEQREALRISEERLRMAASAIQMGVWEAGPEGPRVWDDGMLQIYGISREEFNAHAAAAQPASLWKRYLHPDDLPRMNGLIPVLLQTGERMDIRYRIIRPDGEIRCLRSAGIPVDIGTSKQRAVGITMDVTSEVLAEAKMREARDAAEAANRAKSSFLATMSHEIRTPLNSVITLSNLLGETALDGVQQDYLQTIRSSGELLLAVVNDVLDYTKIEQGKLTLDRVGFSLGSLAEEAVDLVADSARAKGLRVRMEFDASPQYMLIGDPVRLKQVLLNLLSNAVKFTPAGTVTLRVRPEPAPDVYRFSVVDTGLGISPDIRGHLFQAFSQGDASITRRFGGTGLGLAICARFVRLMGGQIGVDSQLNRGSTFWFTAPLAPGSPPQPDAPSRSFLGVGAMVVDEDPADRETLRAQLTALGLRVDCAANALQALTLCAHAPAPYSLFFISARLPVMDGQKLARALRSQPGGDSRILLLTVDRFRPRPDDPPAPGAENGHLFKPAPRRLLERTIGRELDHLHGVGRKPAAAHAGHVLMVEDNRVNQKVALAALKSLGYTADVAPDGIAALELFHRNRYDVILMDCHMPRMDGFTASLVIREVEAGRRRIPIIALTADVLETSRQRCMASGMDDFLSKPLQIAVLRETLDRWRPAPQSP